MEDGGAGDIIFLDRLNVDCGDSAAISQFLMGRDGDQVIIGIRTCLHTHLHMHTLTSCMYCIDVPYQKDNYNTISIAGQVRLHVQRLESRGVYD